VRLSECALDYSFFRSSPAIQRPGSAARHNGRSALAGLPSTGNMKPWRDSMGEPDSTSLRPALVVVGAGIGVLALSGDRCGMVRRWLAASRIVVGILNRAHLSVRVVVA